MVPIGDAWLAASRVSIACAGNRSGREHYSEPEEAATLTARTGVNHRYGAAPDCGI